MKLELGDLAKTVIEKTTYMAGDGEIEIKVGSIGRVCEIFETDNGNVYLLEFDEEQTRAFCLCEYLEDELTQYKD